MKDIMKTIPSDGIDAGYLASDIHNIILAQCTYPSHEFNFTFLASVLAIVSSFSVLHDATGVIRSENKRRLTYKSTLAKNIMPSQTRSHLMPFCTVSIVCSL